MLSSARSSLTASPNSNESIKKHNSLESGSPTSMGWHGQRDISRHPDSSKKIPAASHHGEQSDELLENVVKKLGELVVFTTTAPASPSLAKPKSMRPLLQETEKRTKDPSEPLLDTTSFNRDAHPAIESGQENYGTTSAFTRYRPTSSTSQPASTAEIVSVPSELSQKLFQPPLATTGKPFIENPGQRQSVFKQPFFLSRQLSTHTERMFSSSQSQRQCLAPEKMQQDTEQQLAENTLVIGNTRKRHATEPSLSMSTMESEGVNTALQSSSTSEPQHKSLPANFKLDIEVDENTGLLIKKIKNE